MALEEREFLIRPRSGITRHEWNTYVDGHPSAWFWHRTEWLDYCVDYSNRAVDKSFGVFSPETDNLVGICPVIRIDDRVVMGDDPCIGPVVDDVTVLDVLMLSIRQRLKGLNVGWRWDRHDENDNVISRLREEFGLHVSSFTTSRVALTSTETQRWGRLRKSYRGLIRQTEREHSIETGISLWGGYKECHQNCATRPRPPKTYGHQLEWLRNESARVYGVHVRGDGKSNDGVSVVVTSTSSGERPVDGSSPSLSTIRAAAFVVCYKRRAYYASGPSMQQGLQHALQWRIINDLARDGFESYELGWSDGSGISFFKRGFGSDDFEVDVLRGAIT